MKRIIVNNISKKFKIGFEKNQGALARFISIFSGRELKRILFVLKDISFSAKAGDFIGIIGENASGKSTLLRAIAGIYDIDEGTIRTNGKIITGFLNGQDKTLWTLLSEAEKKELLIELLSISPLLIETPGHALVLSGYIKSEDQFVVNDSLSNKNRRMKCNGLLKEISAIILMAEILKN